MPSDDIPIIVKNCGIVNMALKILEKRTKAYHVGWRIFGSCKPLMKLIVCWTGV